MYIVTKYITYRNRVSFIYLELSWLIISNRHPSSEQVEEVFEQVQIVTSHIGHLKDGTNPVVTHGVTRNYTTLLEQSYAIPYQQKYR